MRLPVLLTCIFLTTLGIFFWYQHGLVIESIQVNQLLSAKQFHALQEQRWEEKKTQAYQHLASLVARGCQTVNVSFTNVICSITHQACINTVEARNLRREAVCLDYGTGHVEPPEVVKGIYMTSLAAGSPSFRERLVELIKATELNTVVIDIKEVDGYTGTVLGESDQFPFQKNLMGDLRSLIQTLHEENIYVIGRLVLFKDQAWAQAYPEQAVQERNQPGLPWSDYQGKNFIDPGATPFWDYLVDLSSVAYLLGFDEIQTDYIRFPSDGKMSTVYYPYSHSLIEKQGGHSGRVHVLNQFMAYYTEKLRTRHPEIILSADVFGMVSTNRDDLTIGQTLEAFLWYFDYVSPMVYPSHYPLGYLGLEGHPDNHPFEVVSHSQSVANQRREALKEYLTTGNLSELRTLITGVNISQETLAQRKIGSLRPWLQDFDCTWCPGYFPYGAGEVREQIQASREAGDSGWLLWNAGNRYTQGALLPSSDSWE